MSSCLLTNYTGVNLQTAECRVHNPSLFMPLLMVGSCNQAISQKPTLGRMDSVYDLENLKWHQLVEYKKWMKWTDTFSHITFSFATWWEWAWTKINSVLVLVHSTLILRLQNFVGQNGLVLNWFRSYISGQGLCLPWRPLNLFRILATFLSNLTVVSRRALCKRQPCLPLSLLLFAQMFFCYSNL